jgi:hypothetical protein
MRSSLFGASIAIMLVLSGCVAPKGYVTLEILEPANVTYPAFVNNVAYLNRSPISFDNMSPSNRRDLDQKELRMIDTMVCNALKAGFYDALNNAQVAYMDSVIYLERRRLDTTGRFDNLTAAEYRRVFETFPVDAVITLDYYSFQLDLSNRYDYTGYSYSQVYTLYLDVGWKIYTSEELTPFNRYRLRDTLFFENFAYEPAVRYTPSDAMRIGFYEAAFSYGQRNIPMWNQVSRYIFKGREKALRKAGEYTDEGDWEGARDIWLSCLESEDPTLRAKAAFNLAVYYELEDDLEQSVAYLEMARRSWNNDSIENYYEEMKIRVENKEELYKQVR